MADPNINLSDTIVTFVADCDLAHQFVNGGINDVVLTENGPIPTFANVIDKNRQAIAVALNVQQSISGWQWNFAPQLIWTVKHNLNTTVFVESLFDSGGNKLYANVKIIDDTEFVVEFTEAQAGFVNVMFYVNP